MSNWLLYQFTQLMLISINYRSTWLFSRIGNAPTKFEIKPEIPESDSSDRYKISNISAIRNIFKNEIKEEIKQQHI